MSNFRVCIQNLALHNAGTHYFQWVDLPMSEDDLDEVCHTIARTPRNAEGEITGEGDELIVVDVEGFPVKAESGSPQRFNAWVDALEKHGEPLAGYIDRMGYSISDDPATISDEYEDAYAGEFASKEDHAEETFRDLYTIPDHLQYYIDWEKVARDFEIGGDFFYIEQGYRTVHAFRNV